MNKKILLISTIVFALDQISKAIIDFTLTLSKSVKIIKNFFYLTYYQNTGAAWGIMANKTYLLIILSIIVLIIIYRYMYSFKLNKRNLLAFGLLLGGIVGNLLDRVIFGYVRDFLDFKIFGYNFPIFNISDCAIVIGIFLLIIAIFKKEEVYERDNSRKERKKVR